MLKKTFKICDDQMITDEYRLAANITEYYIISKLILQRIIITNFCGSKSHVNKEKTLFKSVPKQ